MADKPKLALILSGGGARAAYQAGVARAISEMMPDEHSSPFRIICGTSAGAINAAALAAGARHFRSASTMLCKTWSTLTVGDIYRADGGYFMGAAWRWLRSMFPGADPRRSTALLDFTPLAGLLARTIHFPSIQHSIDAGALDALSITASSYRSGLSVSFCMGGPALELWERSQRVGVRAQIGVSHLLASSAIPFVFPPTRIGDEYFGDGAMCQMAPTAPALHLGADRILVVGAGDSGARSPAEESSGAPSLAQIGSQVLNSVFTDALGTDLEKVRLVNIAVRQIPKEQLAASPMPLRDIMLLVLNPSVSLNTLAGEYRHRLPRALRVAIGGIGGTRSGGEGLLSYLLFDAAYCSALIDLGYRDAQSKRETLARFLSA
jgi:NTE family protein